MRKEIIFLLIIVISICFVCGCASQSQSSTQNTVATPTQTLTIVIPTTVIPTTSITPEITDIQNIKPNETVTSVSILPIISPKADPTDPSKITFNHYEGEG